MLVDIPYLYCVTDFDREIFQRFVSRDHPLAVALREIDWEGFRSTVEAFYDRDRGQPAIDPLRMLKLEFLRYWSNLSDRQVIQRTETDLAYRYFLDVGYTFRPPDSSSLSYFRGRLGEQGFVAVFDQLVAQSRRAGLVKDRLRLKDASHVVASIAVPTTLTLVAQIRDRLLLASEPFDPDWVSGQRIEVNLLRPPKRGWRRASPTCRSWSLGRKPSRHRPMPKRIRPGNSLSKRGPWLGRFCKTARRTPNARHFRCTTRRRAAASMARTTTAISPTS